MNYMMEKEIASQSDIIGVLIEKYVKNNRIDYVINDKFNDIVLVASGSSYNAALLAKHFFEKISKISADVEYASEFAFKDVVFKKDTLYIFISQSGKSTDTLSAFEKAKKNNVKTLCVTNNLNSPMHKNSDFNFYIEAGIEYAIAATKTFMASICALWLISLSFAQSKNLDISFELSNCQNFSKIFRQNNNR